MDYATAVGLITGIILIIASIAVEGNPLTFVNIPSILVVIGGTLAALHVAFPFATVKRVVKVAINAFRHETGDPNALISDLVRYAEVARRDGILALEDAVDDMSDEFMVKGTPSGFGTGGQATVLTDDDVALFEQNSLVRDSYLRQGLIVSLPQQALCEHGWDGPCPNAEQLDRPSQEEGHPAMQKLRDVLPEGDE